MQNFFLTVNAAVQNKKTWKEKFNIIVNILVGLGLAIFFGYTMSISCGAYYIVEILACILYIALNIYYLHKTQRYSKAQMIGFVAGNLTVSIIGIVYIFVVLKQSMCDQFWCLDSSTSNITIISDYEQAFDQVCDGPSYRLSQKILEFASENLDADATEITGYDYSNYITFQVVLLVFPFIFLLEVFVYSYFRKTIQDHLLEGQENNS